MIPCCGCGLCGDHIISLGKFIVSGVDVHLGTSGQTAHIHRIGAFLLVDGGFHLVSILVQLEVVLDYHLAD